MFYCDDCALREDWPITLFKSSGPCEVCRLTARCNDYPSWRLPPPRKDRDAPSK